MRVWKLEACKDEERHPSRWGHVLAETREGALELCRQTSGLPFNWVHDKDPKMLWPGKPGEVVDWS